MIKTTFKCVFILFFLTLVSSCKRGPEILSAKVTGVSLDVAQEGNLTPYLKGNLNQSFIDALEALPENTVTIGINSEGGDSLYGIRIANLIAAKKMNVIVDGELGLCASGCAEYILPAANSLKFTNDPLIGFHQNPQIIYHLLESHLPNEVVHCASLKNQISETKNLLLSRGMKSDFWKHTLQEIDLEYFDAKKIKNMCPSADWKFHNELWFPTSAQISSLLGLTFEGSVCANDFVKCTPKVDELFSSGTKVVIGSTLYISKGNRQ